MKKKKVPTIKDCVSNKPITRKKWNQGIYAAKQANRMRAMGFSEFKIDLIIKKNREEYSYG